MADPTRQSVLVEQAGAVRVLTIDRPEKRNALDIATLASITEALGEATAAGARAVVIRGAGGHFCAGADLGGGGGGGPSDGPSYVSHLNDALAAVTGSKLPVVAAVEGAALGAGMQLAAACDLRCVAPDARLGVPAAKLGVMMDLDRVRALARAVGDGTARAMLLGAEVFSGADLHRLGFAQRLGSPADAVEWAHDLAALAPLTIAGHKLGLSAYPDPDEYRVAFEAAWSSEDLQEGTASFRERRAPLFRGL